jgi:hypothetical protein
MTPAEARQIDQEEFAAECAAIRQRAYAYVEQCRHEARSQIASWLGRELPKLSFRNYPNDLPKQPRKKRIFNPPTYTVNGITLSMTQWAERLGINRNTLQQRVHRLGSFEAAVSLGSGDQRRTALVTEPST